MKNLFLTILLLALPLVCSAQDATTRATPKCEKYRQGQDGIVYAVIEIKILDKEIYDQYLKKVRPIGR